MTLTKKFLSTLVGCGYTSKEISWIAGVSKGTIQKHCKAFDIALPKGLPVGFKKERK
jgi:transposase